MRGSQIKEVDIAICTWNRASLLSQTLASISQLDIPAHIQLTLLLVDNRSTDQTPDVIRAFEATPFGNRHSVKSLFEPQPGHTVSRNRAVAAAEGDLILWTDDDVSVAKNWVAQYVAAADESPQFSFWGSVIEPQFETDRPKWIGENWDLLKGCFAYRDLGEEPIELNESRLPYGANFAIRTEIQKTFRFDQQLGRRGNQVNGEDEVDLLRRMIDQGHRGGWVPHATVKHVIPVDRATEKYVYDYFVGQGRALAAKGTPWHENEKQLKRESVQEYVKYKAKRWLTASSVWVSHLVRSALAKGQSLEMQKK